MLKTIKLKFIRLLNPYLIEPLSLTFSPRVKAINPRYLQPNVLITCN